MAYENIIVERKGRVTHITLNRPRYLNAINDALNQELVDALQEFDMDEEAWVAILSGTGRAFSSGADVRQRQLRSREELVRLGGPAAVRSSEGSLGLGRTVNWKPVIAAVHGYVLGAGYGIAMECDLVVAAEGTQLQIREVQRGIAGWRHWVRTWYWGGGRLATEVALTGRMFSAEEALQLGMVNRVVPQDRLLQEAEALAKEIMANPPLSVRANVRISRMFVRELVRESDLYGPALKLHLTEDFRESALAFVEKRPPVFHGR